MKGISTCRLLRVSSILIPFVISNVCEFIYNPFKSPSHACLDSITTAQKAVYA